MRKALTLILVVAAALGVVPTILSQTGPTTHWYWAADYGQYALKGQQANTYTWQPGGFCSMPQVGGGVFVPFATTAPIWIQDQTVANSETVTPSAVSVTGSTCSISISPSHSHVTFWFRSGTGGLQEALNSLNKTATVAAVVFLDRQWYQYAAAVPGTTPAAILAAATGGVGIDIVDITTAPWTWYHWNGSAYIPGNGQPGPGTSNWTYFVNSELVTLATGAQTTDTAGNLLPANSYIDQVQGVVNTTITAACTGWELGDATTAARFEANDTTLTAGEAVPNATHPPLQVGAGVASAVTGVYQASAAKVRITCAGGNPGAGKVRVVVFGRTWANPAN